MIKNDNNEFCFDFLRNFNNTFFTEDLLATAFSSCYSISWYYVSPINFNKYSASLMSVLDFQHLLQVFFISRLERDIHNLFMLLSIS